MLYNGTVFSPNIRTFCTPSAVLALCCCSAQGIESIAEKQDKYVGNQRQDMISDTIINTTASATTTVTVVSATHSITKMCPSAMAPYQEALYRTGTNRRSLPDGLTFKSKCYIH